MYNAQNAPNIFILGLRRSGTTAFWECFRNDSRFTCYDEPFNPNIGKTPREHKKGVRREYLDLYYRDPDGFSASYCPIRRYEETGRTFSEQQRVYLHYLLRQRPCVFDFTRCHFRIQALADIDPDAVCVHLYRKASAFVTSHLIPSDRGDLLSLRKMVSRSLFFSRHLPFNRWGMEHVIRGDRLNKGLSKGFFEAESVVFSPEYSSCEALLAYWLVCYRFANRVFREYFPNRTVVVSFEEFCESPSSEVSKVYSAAGLSGPEFSIDGIRNASQAFAGSDARWVAAARKVNFSPNEIEHLLI